MKNDGVVCDLCGAPAVGCCIDYIKFVSLDRPWVADYEPLNKLKPAFYYCEEHKRDARIEEAREGPLMYLRRKENGSQ